MTLKAKKLKKLLIQTILRSLPHKAAEVEIKDAEEEEDADEPENFEETMDAASESEE